MKTVRKTILATAVAAAMAPGAALAEATLFGTLDAAVEIGSAEETAVQTDTHGSEIGLKGSQELDDGGEAIYHVRWDFGSVTDASAGSNILTDEIYVGLKHGWGEVRVGTMDLPGRLAVQAADIFADTVADIDNVVVSDDQSAGNRNNTIMYLNSTDTVDFAGSLSFRNEDANNEDALDALTISAMAGIKLGENGVVNVAVTQDTETTSGADDDVTVISLTGALDLGDGITVSGVFEQNMFGDAIEASLGSDELSSVQIGATLPSGDKGTFKAAFAMLDASDEFEADPTLVTVGYDHQCAENVKVYALVSAGSEGGNAVRQDVDADGDSTVVAGGINVKF